MENLENIQNMKDMKPFNVTLIFSKVGTSTILVPKKLTLQEAIQYAKEHIREIPLPIESEYISDSDIIDEDNCDFDEE